MPEPCQLVVGCIAAWVCAFASAEPMPPAQAASAAAPEEARPAPADFRLPAIEIVGFELLVNRANRAFGTGRDDYRVTLDSIRRNLHSGWGTDHDPFDINQLGHPLQGAMYHGFARSAGLGYWPSLGMTFAGSALWEIAGERTRPSRNDQIASGIGGTFLGEALFRMSNLVLERGGGLPRFWREAAATAIAPSAGFNRLVFGERAGGVFSSHDAAYFSRLEFGYNGSATHSLGTSNAEFRHSEAQLGFAIDYGMPGNPSYTYTRPFDYFAFQAAASSANGIENVLTRGLLIGQPYELGSKGRGVWGLYGSYDYIAPQTFRVSTTALSIGSTAQWWLGESLALQGSALLGVGYAAVGTTRGRADDRDYNYGVAPQALLALRLIYGERMALDLTAREYFVSNVASGTSGGHDNIVRGDLALTWRVSGPHALTLKVLGNRRDARFDGSGSRQQQVTVGVFYTLLGQDRFGAVDWR